MEHPETSLASELEAERDDEEAWEEEPTDIEVRPRRTEVVSFRLPPEELDELEDAAAAAGESISDFVRSAIRLRLEPTRFEESLLDVWAGAGTWIIRALHGAHEASSRSDVQGWVYVPEFPPELATEGFDQHLPLEYTSPEADRATESTGDL